MAPGGPADGGMLRYIRNTFPVQAMVATKVATLNLRIDPVLKEAVRIAALRDRRSIANLIEVLIRQHCVQHGISIPEQRDLSLGSDDE